MKGILGCGEYTVWLQSRGGGPTRIMEVPWKTITWSRVLDDTSQATIINPIADCCGLLTVMNPWQHEISINRTPAPTSNVEVWVGPVYSPQPQPPDASSHESDIQIACRDLSVWFDKRKIHDDLIYDTGTADLATMFEDIVGSAMNPDNSPGISVVGSPTGITGIRTYLQDQNLLAGPELRNLSNIGVDWTTYIRQILMGGTTVFNPAAQIGPFLDQHFIVPPTVIRDGSKQYNSVTQIGSGTAPDGGNAIFQVATDTDAQNLYGLLEQVVTDTTILDDPSALAGAESALALGASIVQITNAVLTPDAPFQMSQLIPGVLCEINLNESCVPVAGLFRLQRVDVMVDVSAEQTETVTLTFQPVGTN